MIGRLLGARGEAVEPMGIGASLPRLEDERYLRGRSQFVGDIAFPGCSTPRSCAARMRTRV